MTSPLSPATTGASADGARPVPPLVVLIGPTASGKSSLAIQLARSLDASGHPAEIVNGDSMAIYAGMDIGTAKPSASDRALVPHHLVDVLEVTQTSTVADFQQLAREVIARLRSSGRIPILVGGIVPVRASGHRRLRVPRDRSAGARPVGARAGRPRRCRTVRGAGSSRPQARGAIEPANSRRIVRALEVLELTGHYSPHLPPPHYLLVNVHQFGLVVDREEMDRRIEERVHAMFDAGLVDEVRRLEGRGLRRGSLPPGPWAISRCWQCSTANSTSRAPSGPRSTARADSRASNSAGSDVTRASNGCPLMARTFRNESPRGCSRPTGAIERRCHNGVHEELGVRQGPRHHE